MLELEQKTIFDEKRLMTLTYFNKNPTRTSFHHLFVVKISWERDNRQSLRRDFISWLQFFSAASLCISVNSLQSYQTGKSSFASLVSTGGCCTSTIKFNDASVDFRNWLLRLQPVIFYRSSDVGCSSLPATFDTFVQFIFFLRILNFSLVSWQKNKYFSSQKIFKGKLCRYA